jgi:3,4-dihydroxy 2-butanone 4-phosphate synthase / GTP cyclohydrolase II
MNSTESNILAETGFRLNSIEEAIEDIRLGKVIIVVDDEDRENEGDLICAAETITPEIINFMATHGRGLICTPIDERRADELELFPMVTSNTSLHETAFTVSIDLIGHGCSTGISAYDRATGIKHILDPSAKSSDYARPGHIFPLRAKSGGVLRRTGHTEATVDLARLAGYYPAGVLVEILNEDGSMARLPQLIEISKRFELKIISIKDLVTYRMKTERLIKRAMTTTIQTKKGNIDVVVYDEITTGEQHIAFKIGNITSQDPTLVRVHSNHEIGDVLSFVLGNQGFNLNAAMNNILENKKGVLLYMRHSGSGETLVDKVNHFKNLYEKGLKPESMPMDQRDFGVGAQILRDLGVGKIKLITNNPKKRIGLIGYGLEIVENIELSK